MKLTRQERIEFFNNVKPKDDFNFKFLGDFTKESRNLLNYLNSNEYKEQYIVLEEDYKSILGGLKIEIVLHTFNREQCEEPYEPKYVTNNLKLIELCKPILKRLEDIYDGRSSSLTLHVLPAHTNVPIHSDSQRPAEIGELALSRYLNLCHRVHIPLITNDKVIFNINGEEKILKFGEAWETNTDVLHEVKNTSDFDRLHLHINILPNKWL